MNARLRVPCPVWGDRSQRAFHVAMWRVPVPSGRKSLVVKVAREISASWAQSRRGRPWAPAAAQLEAGVRRGAWHPAARRW